MPWRTAGSGALSSRRLEQVRRDVEVLELRGRGLTFEEIAARCGYANRSGAQKAVKRALASGGESADRDELVVLEWLRLEELHAVLWSEVFDGDLSPRRRLQLIGRLLRIAELEARLTGNFERAPRLDGRRRPQRKLGVWTKGLQLRTAGGTLGEIAEQLGLSHRSAAGRRLTVELRDYAAGHARAYRDQQAAALDALQQQYWADASAAPVSLGAVDEVLAIISRRIGLLDLATANQPPQRRGGRRPPPEPGPNATIILGAYLDPDERARVEALLDEARQCEPGDVSPPTCVTDEPDRN